MKYFGKYRAIVQNVKDPEKRGRIRVACPKVLGDAISNWCEPCVPVAIDLEGDFAIPPVGEAVWIEFEEGEANQPIWVGGWWSINRTPASATYNTSIRHISWKNCEVKMQKDLLELKIGSSTIKLTPSNISMSANSISIPGYERL